MTAKNIFNVLQHLFKSPGVLKRDAFYFSRSCTTAELEVKEISTKYNLTIEDIEKESLKHPDYFGVSKLYTVEDLFQSRVHLGHREGTLNKYMLPYIYGSRLDHLLIDLDQTAENLRNALNFTAHIAFREGIILFVCRTAAHQMLIEQTAMECKEYAHTREFWPGTFTNSTVVFGCPIRLPDLVIVLNTLDTTIKESAIVTECAKLRIPTIGVVDTNCDPRLITYPIPGNDDSHASMSLYCKLFKYAILLGKNKLKSLNKDSV